MTVIEKDWVWLDAFFPCGNLDLVFDDVMPQIFTFPATSRLAMVK